MTKTISFRRKRERKTNYRKRLRLLLSGMPRLVARKSLNNILLQMVEYSPDGDKVVLSAHSSELAKKFNWKMSTGNVPSAYLTGLLIGKRAKKKGIKNAILDMGMHVSVKNSRIYSALKGAIDAGLEIPYAKEMAPPDDILKGKKIADYAAKLKKENSEKYKKQFSLYIGNGVEPEKIPGLFEETKKKIMSEDK